MDQITVHHFNQWDDFEQKVLVEGVLVFPELEAVLRQYLLSQPREVMEFKECIIKEEEGIRNVEVAFHDHRSDYYIRLWGQKSMKDDAVLEMVVDAVDLRTKEEIYKRQLV